MLRLSVAILLACTLCITLPTLLPGCGNTTIPSSDTNDTSDSGENSNSGAPDTTSGQAYLFTNLDDGGSELLSKTAISARTLNEDQERYGWLLLDEDTNIEELSDDRRRLVSYDPLSENPTNVNGEQLEEAIEELLGLTGQQNPYEDEAEEYYFFWHPGMGDHYSSEHRVGDGEGGWVMIFGDEIDAIPGQYRNTLMDGEGHEAFDQFFDDDDFLDPQGMPWDFCEEEGFYDDGVCDPMCPKPDPDCGSNGESSPPDFLNGDDQCMILGFYGDGFCDPMCLQPDPDCGTDGLQSEDPCVTNRKYGDGVCDHDCCNPDPDCTEGAPEGDPCFVFGWYGDGICDPNVMCQFEDPDCVGTNGEGGSTQATCDPGDGCNPECFDPYDPDCSDVDVCITQGICCPDGFCDPDCPSGQDLDCQVCGMSDGICIQDCDWLSGTPDPDCTAVNTGGLEATCNPGDGCKPDCHSPFDTDCTNEAICFEVGYCCADSVCDEGCPAGNDPDCSDTSTNNGFQSTCSPGDGCKPDCTDPFDSDCTNEAICFEIGYCCADSICDSGCPTGPDPDCTS